MDIFRLQNWTIIFVTPELVLLVFIIIELIIRSIANRRIVSKLSEIAVSRGKSPGGMTFLFYCLFLMLLASGVIIGYFGGFKIWSLFFAEALQILGCLVVNEYADKYRERHKYDNKAIHIKKKTVCEKEPYEPIMPDNPVTLPHACLIVFVGEKSNIKEYGNYFVMLNNAKVGEIGIGYTLRASTQIRRNVTRLSGNGKSSKLYYFDIIGDNPSVEIHVRDGCYVTEHSKGIKHVKRNSPYTG